jgi:hypothetical protein
MTSDSPCCWRRDRPCVAVRLLEMHVRQILLQRAHLVHVSEGEEMLYEQFIARDVADRHGGRVAHASLGRNGVDLLDHGVDLP